MVGVAQRQSTGLWPQGSRVQIPSLTLLTSTTYVLITRAFLDPSISELRVSSFRIPSGLSASLEMSYRIDTLSERSPVICLVASLGTPGMIIPTLRSHV